MVEFKRGDIFKGNHDCIINPVNSVGVMGAGLALVFRLKFPANYDYYYNACQSGDFNAGDILGFKTKGIAIINAATKQHWKQPSKIEYIESCLIAINKKLNDNDFKSVGIPALGCGKGGLLWGDVKPLMAELLKDVDTSIYIYEPESY